MGNSVIKQRSKLQAAHAQTMETPCPTDLEARCSLAESLTDASIDSLVAMDERLFICKWNATAEIWSGKKRADVEGKYFFDVFPEARKTPGLQEALQHALAGRKAYLPSGPGFYLRGYFESHFVPLKNDHDQVTGVLQIMHDVSHRIKAENELRRLNEEQKQQYAELQRASAELANFAKVASHDLKEPLRKIYTFSELILVHEAAKLSSSGRSNFRRIQTSVQRMSLLTDDIVNFAEISINNEPLRELDVNEVVRDAVFPLSPEMAQLEAVLIMEPLPKIEGYAGALQQLFSQLAGNALKFHLKDVPPRIYISCEQVSGDALHYPEARPDRSYYRITMRDNGIGFEPQYAERIFGMFQRAHPEGNYKGSGMGLPIARKIAFMHGGFIVAEGQPEQGSAFHCYLPCMPED